MIEDITSQCRVPLAQDTQMMHSDLESGVGEIRPPHQSTEDICESVAVEDLGGSLEQ